MTEVKASFVLLLVRCLRRISLDRVYCDLFPI